MVRNKYCHYISCRIMTTNISMYQKYLLSLYIFLYNDNKHFNYTSSRIRRYTVSYIKKCLLSLYVFLYNKK